MNGTRHAKAQPVKPVSKTGSTSAKSTEPHDGCRAAETGIRQASCPSSTSKKSNYGPRDWHLLKGKAGINGHRMPSAETFGLPSFLQRFWRPCSGEDAPRGLQAFKTRSGPYRGLGEPSAAGIEFAARDSSGPTIDIGSWSRGHRDAR